jgi:hypothetical protein
MLEPEAVRLELVKVMIPVASRHGLTSAELVESCTRLEKYVLGLSSVGEAPTPTPRKTLTRPVKDNQVPSFLSQ